MERLHKNSFNEETSFLTRLSEDQFKVEKITRPSRLAKINCQHFEFLNFVYYYYVDGCPTGPTIVTLHDIGQNSIIAFDEYFSETVTEPILNEFQIVHVTLPGQLNEDVTLHSYPNFDDMSGAVCHLMERLKKSYVVGFGIGAGANILIRSYLSRPHLFSRLILINGYISPMGWMDWITQKYYTYLGEPNHLTKDSKLSNLLIDHFFMDVEPSDTSYETYLNFLEKIDDTNNLKLLLESYAHRTAINLDKPNVPINQLIKIYHTQVITCPTLILISDTSPHYEDSVALINHIDPSLVDFLEFKHAHGFLLNLYTLKVTHAICLFLQGMGHLKNLDLKLFRETKVDFSAI